MRIHVNSLQERSTRKNPSLVGVSTAICKLVTAFHDTPMHPKSSDHLRLSIPHLRGPMAIAAFCMLIKILLNPSHKFFMSGYGWFIS